MGRTKLDKISIADALITKRKAELLKQYPNGEAIGRITIQDLINHKKSTGDARQYKPTLTNGDIGLLQDVLTEEDWEVYNRYIRLHETLTKLANTLLVFQQSFSHGFYRILYFLQPAIIGLSAYCKSTDLNSSSYKKKCEDQLLLVEQGLKTIWHTLILEPLKAIYRYDFAIDLLAQSSNFDLDVFRPGIAEREGEVRVLQREMRVLIETIHAYKQAKNEDKIALSLKTLRTLKELSGVKVDRFKPSQRVRDKIAGFINDKSGIDRYLVDKILQIP